VKAVADSYNKKLAKEIADKIYCKLFLGCLTYNIYCVWLDGYVLR